MIQARLLRTSKDKELKLVLEESTRVDITELWYTVQRGVVLIVLHLILLTVAAEEMLSSGGEEERITSSDGLWMSLCTADVEGLSVVIATGPFSTSDNILFEPLNDLMTSLDNDDSPPDVLVLVCTTVFSWLYV